MDKAEIKDQVGLILAAYDPADPEATANALRQLWLQFDPKSIDGIKAEQRQLQETVGIPVPVLKSIGAEIGKVARKQVDEYLILARLLWDSYGREGRVVAVIPLGKMELAQPEKIMPVLREMCRTCYTWEDADQLAMAALEPVVRKDPQNWLPRIEPWLVDRNKWVRRTGITVAGRLPMKHPTYTTRSLQLAEGMLLDEEKDVQRAVSFAIRICARGDVQAVLDFLDRNVPPEDPAATWVLCDSIRSMTKSFLPEIKPVLPNYQRWAVDPTLTPQNRRSVESAVKTLQAVT